MEYYTDIVYRDKVRIELCETALIRGIQRRGANARESRMLERRSSSRNEVVRDI